MNKTIIRPFGQNLLVSYEEKEQVAGSSQSFTDVGTVMAIGDKVTDTKVGDKIATTLWGINSFEYEGAKYYIVPESDEFLLAKITNDNSEITA